MFDLVADVPRYPEFLPWCTAARVRKREGPNVEIDELAIGFGPLHEKFVSRVTTTPDDPDGLRIETVGIEGPFQALVSHWRSGRIPTAPRSCSRSNSSSARCCCSTPCACCSPRR